MPSPLVPNITGPQALQVGKLLAENGDGTDWPRGLSYRREPIDTYAAGEAVDAAGGDDCDSLAMRWAQAFRAHGVPVRLVRKRISSKTAHWWLEIRLSKRWRTFDPSVSGGMRPLKPEQYRTTKEHKVLVNPAQVNTGELDEGSGGQKVVNPLESKSYDAVVGGVAAAATAANPVAGAAVLAVGAAAKGIAGLLTEDKQRRLHNKKARKVNAKAGKKVLPVIKGPSARAYALPAATVAAKLGARQEDVKAAQLAWQTILDAGDGDKVAQQLVGAAVSADPTKRTKAQAAIVILVLSDPANGISKGFGDCCHACAIGEKAKVADAGIDEGGKKSRITRTGASAFAKKGRRRFKQHPPAWGGRSQYASDDAGHCFSGACEA